MTTSRRDFIERSAAAYGALTLGFPATALGMTPGHAREPVREPLRILFIGGTGFIGPHMVRAALAAGHTPTLFNRGRTNPHLFPDVEKLRGDRDGGLGVLEDRAWDAVIDTSGYVPRLVRESLRWAGVSRGCERGRGEGRSGPERGARGLCSRGSRRRVPHRGDR